MVHCALLLQLDTLKARVRATKEFAAEVDKKNAEALRKAQKPRGMEQQVSYILCAGQH